MDLLACLSTYIYLPCSNIRNLAIAPRNTGEAICIYARLRERNMLTR